MAGKNASATAGGLNRFRAGATENSANSATFENKLYAFEMDEVLRRAGDVNPLICGNKREQQGTDVPRSAVVSLCVFCVSLCFLCLFVASKTDVACGLIAGHVEAQGRKIRL